MKNNSPFNDRERRPAGMGNPDSKREPPAEAIQAEVSKILASKGFAHSERLSRFLRFIVDQTIEGRGDELKEYLLGLEVFAKDESFDPRIDTVVRVEAHRLRSRLKEYYQGLGQTDPIFIELPKGTYSPTFRYRQPAVSVKRPIRVGLRLRSKWGIGAVIAVLLAGLATYRLAFHGTRDAGGRLPERVASVAVLPFADLSPKGDQEYFCDGITDELINALARVPGLHVVSRTSAFAFKKKPQDVRRIGERLNVSVVLEGSVRKMGDRMRITAQLIDVADGYHVWSDSFDRSTRDVFAVQEEISRAIVSALKVQLAGGQGERLVKHGTRNLEAYHLYLKGRYHWNKRTGQGLGQGIEFFEQAIALDPNYAPAYAGLADSYAMLASYGVSRPRDAMPKARAAARKALQIDDALAEAHASLGLVESFFDWDWAGAELEYKRAIELNANCTTAHQWYSGCLRAVGRLEEALAEIQQAQELDPLSPAISRDAARVYRSMRQHERAIEQYRKTLELEPEFPSTYLHLGLEYEAESRHEDAIATLTKAKSLPGRNSLILGGLGYCFASCGKRGEALQLLSELRTLSTRGYVSPMPMTLIYIGLGEKDLAFKELERAYEERDRWLAWLKVDPVFDSLRQEPQFNSLLKRVGLSGPS